VQVCCRKCRKERKKAREVFFWNILFGVLPMRLKEKPLFSFFFFGLFGRSEISWRQERECSVHSVDSGHFLIDFKGSSFQIEQIFDKILSRLRIEACRLQCEFQQPLRTESMQCLLLEYSLRTPTDKSIRPPFMRDLLSKVSTRRNGSDCTCGEISSVRSRSYVRSCSRMFW
jgi:hypothetical protein